MDVVVRADAVVPCAAHRAEDRLERVFRQPREIVVGPGRGRVRKHVVADLTPVTRRGGTKVLSLRWRPLPPLATCFPALQGRLGITAIDDTTSLLTFEGGYRPPLGALGALADRLVLRRAAASTAAVVTRRLAAQLTRPGGEGGTR